MHILSSEMDNRATYSACRGILLVCLGILLLCRGVLSLCRGILLDVMIHAATQNNENEVEWFWPQKRDALQLFFSSTGYYQRGSIT